MSSVSGNGQVLKCFNDEIICFKNYLKEKDLDKLVEKRLETFIDFNDFRKVSRCLLFRFGYYSEYLVKLFIIVSRLNSHCTEEFFKKEFREFNGAMELADDEVFDFNLTQIQNGDCVFLCKLVVINTSVLYWYSSDVEAIFDFDGNLVCTADSFFVLLYKLVVKRIY